MRTNWSEILIVIVFVIVVAFGAYMAIFKNINSAGIGSYSVVVTLSETDREILKGIKEALEKK